MPDVNYQIHLYKTLASIIPKNILLFLIVILPNTFETHDKISLTYWKKNYTLLPKLESKPIVKLNISNWPTFVYTAAILVATYYTSEF